MNKIYALITFTIRQMMKFIWNLQIINKDKFSQLDNCIIAANHISFFDPPFIGSIIPAEIYYLAKAELFKNKIFAKFLLSLNTIPIRRGVIDRNAIEEVGKKLGSGHSILLFPEGTRKSSKVKYGIGKIASETRKNILPIYIKNSDKLWQCFFRRKRLQIVIGEMINISEFSENEDKKVRYKQIAEYTLKKIYELDDECKNS